MWLYFGLITLIMAYLHIIFLKTCVSLILIGEAGREVSGGGGGGCLSHIASYWCWDRAKCFSTPHQAQVSRKKPFNPTSIINKAAMKHAIKTFFLKRSTYFPQIIWKVYQNRNYVKLESVWTLLRVTHLAPSKSYLVIICPNSQEKLTRTLFRITHLGNKKSYLVIIGLNSHETFWFYLPLFGSKIKNCHI